MMVRCAQDPWRIFVFTSGPRVESFLRQFMIAVTRPSGLSNLIKMRFESNVEALGEAEMGNFRERHQVGYYGWGDFRDDVLAALGEPGLRRSVSQYLRLSSSIHFTNFPFLE